MSNNEQGISNVEGAVNGQRVVTKSWVTKSFPTANKEKLFMILSPMILSKTAPVELLFGSEC